MKLKKSNDKVAIIMGSQSDYPVMKDCEKILKILKISISRKKSGFGCFFVNIQYSKNNQWKIIVINGKYNYLKIM